MTTSAASPNGHRLLAVIAPGAGPHLVGAPATSHWTTRPARPRVSLADELADRLTLLDEDPEGFLSALRDVCLLHGERATAEVLERWITQPWRSDPPGRR